MIVIDASALVNVLLHRRLYASIEKRMREAGRLGAPHLIDAKSATPFVAFSCVVR